MPPPEFNPATVMVAKILELQAAVPFRPVLVTTSDGRSYEIPTPDRITVTRLLRQVEIEPDQGIGATITPLHIASIERGTETAA